MSKILNSPQMCTLLYEGLNVMRSLYIIDVMLPSAYSM